MTHFLMGLDFLSYLQYTYIVLYLRNGIEVVLTALTRNRPGDLEHPLAEILIFQGFLGLEKVRTSCFLSWFSLQFTG